MGAHLRVALVHSIHDEALMKIREREQLKLDAEIEKDNLMNFLTQTCVNRISQDKHSYLKQRAPERTYKYIKYKNCLI